MAADATVLPGPSSSGLLLIISGPSGVGKTTITRAVEAAIPGAVFSVSATTRPKTPADREGVDYHFVTPDEFARMEQSGEFLETADVFGRLYGTPRRWVEERLSEGRLVILEIDVVGAERVKSQIPEAFGIFILPPDEATLLARLRARKREPEEIIQRRFAEAKREIAQARAGRAYEHFVVNDDLPRATRQTTELVRAELARRSNVG